ncbi:YARHG domain-containing protein [Lachnospiraceae bacterium 62-35]
MKCGKCGFQAPENTKFCPKCGNPLKTTCPRCGKEIPSGTKFCSGCGMTIQSAGTVPNQRGQGMGNVHFQGGTSGPGRKGPQSHKSPVLLILMILLVLLILGAAGGGIYYFLQDSGTTAEEHDRSRDDWDDEEDEDDLSDEDDDPAGDEGETRADDGNVGDGREDNDSEETFREGQESSPTGRETTSDSGASYETPGYEMPTAAQTQPGSSYNLPTQPSYRSETMPQNSYGSSGDYILPDSAVRYLSSVELAGLSKDQLRLARNEIYARHGRTFSSEDLQNYFNSKSWYHGTVSPSNFNGNILNDYEKKNLTLIQEEEKKLQ